jgi:acyl-CoA hydrolase
MANLPEQNPCELSMTLLMTPDLANFSGKVHGGAIMKMLDQVAYSCASRYSGSYVVTVSVDQIDFKEPVHIGELVTFFAAVNYTGKTSMEIGIKVIAENVQTRSRRHTNTSYFTMIAVDENGKPKPVPTFKPKTDVAIYRYEMAKLRRELAKEHRQKLEAVKRRHAYFTSVMEQETETLNGT